MHLFRKRSPRVVVLGLDCAAPELAFEQFQADMPTLSAMRRQGVWGELESTIPCITVPAWTSMLSSRDPGTLGIYGFRNRLDHSYKSMTTADSTAVRYPRIWDVLGKAGKTSVVIGTPQTYPVAPLQGEMVGCFLTPGTESAFAYPAMLKQEVLRKAPGYRFDTRNFRTEDKQQLYRSLMEMTEVQFQVVEHLLTTHPWDYFMYVNIGVDRLHHGFWRFHDPLHRLHQPGHALYGVIREYYKLVDAQIRRVMDIIGDDTIVLVVSDHGARRMDGAICINEWLWRNGWLSLRTPPRAGEIISIDQADIDWSRTQAWASGGYYARVFLNVSDRELEGTVPPDAYAETRAALAEAIRQIPGPDGQPLHHLVYQPEHIYAQVNGIAPDLMVYFGDLHWRAVGGLGYPEHYTFENDTGPDDANHAPNGLFVLYDPRASARGERTGHQLMDIAPTLLTRMRVAVPLEMQGGIIH